MILAEIAHVKSKTIPYKYEMISFVAEMVHLQNGFVLFST